MLGPRDDSDTETLVKLCKRVVSIMDNFAKVTLKTIKIVAKVVCYIK